MKLNNGVEIPDIGYGVYEIPPKITKECVLTALKIGYRHIDTAAYYKNEREVGEATRESGIPRNEIFVTTKICLAGNYQKACKKIEDCLARLGLDYIDLLLYHWPSGKNVEVYKAMEDYYKKGKIRAIGLSNFYGKKLDEILANCEIVPAVNQIETHVLRNQKEEQALLESKGIVLESWSPLGNGSKKIFNNEILLKIAAKHQKTVAQVSLRYLYQRKVLIIPRSKNEGRMRENFNILDFMLDEEDIKEIETLDRKKSLLGWL